MLFRSVSQSRYEGGGIGFSGLLTIVFIVLKLTGHINWSWVWVLAPLWGGIALVILMVLILFPIIFLGKKR